MFGKKKSPNLPLITNKKVSIFDSKLDATETLIDTEMIPMKEESKEYINFTHFNSITDLETSSKYIYSSGIDKVICIWSKKTRKCKRVLYGHTDIITCFKVINEQNIISGSEDCSIRIWNLKEKNPIIINYSDKITCLDYDIMNQIILFGTKKGKILGIDWNNKKIIDLFKNKQNHQKQINDILIKDSIIYSSSMDGYIKLWSIDDGSLILAKLFSQPVFSLKIIDSLFYILHYTSVSVCDSNWSLKPPFLSICDFTIFQKLLIGWNRIKSEIELWDIETRDLLYKEKIQGAIFIKKLKYDENTGILYFALSNSISFIQLNLKKIKNLESTTPSYVIFNDIYDYCVHTLLFPSEIVVKIIEESFQKDIISISSNLETNITNVITEILKQIPFGISSWRRPLENFFFVVYPSNNKIEQNNIYSNEELNLNFKEKINTFYKVLPKENRNINFKEFNLFETFESLSNEEIKMNFNLELKDYNNLWKIISEKYFKITTDNTHFIKSKESFKNFKIIGKLLGHCIYQNKLPLKNIHLCRVLLKMIISKPIIYEDLECVEKSNFWNTEQLLKSEDVSIFRLKNPKGEDVTENNKIEYIKMIVKNNLYNSCEKQIDSFLIGLYEIIPKSYFKIFNQDEIELFLFESNIDSIEDWIKYTKYNGYNINSQIIIWFWEILKEFNSFQRSKLLQFTTGTTYFNGFKNINPEFQISKLYSKDHGIISHFDLNRIDIPEYSTKEELLKELIKKLKL